MSTNKTVKEAPKFNEKRNAPAVNYDQINVLDHNDLDKLSRFISDRGKILPRRNTGFLLKTAHCCRFNRARNLGILLLCRVKRHCIKLF